MNEKSGRHEETVAIETCIRAFIIKSIHAVVQARNGIVNNTNCISDVGARNNLMVYIEEDPEIGATIKETLDTGFPVRVRDVLCLEILAVWRNNPRFPTATEIWQFRLDTAACDQTIPPEVANQRVCSEQTSHPIAEVTVEDFRRSRLIEKLGTLLKSIAVVTRLLPAYQLSRRQESGGYDMCYTLRRGSIDLSRLGHNPKFQQVGCLFTGLAINRPGTEEDLDMVVPTATTAVAAGPIAADVNLALGRNLLPVYLYATVHYRSEPFPMSAATQTMTSQVSGLMERTLTSDTGRTKSSWKSSTRLRTRVRPAFADSHSDECEDEDDVDQLCGATNRLLRMDSGFPQARFRKQRLSAGQCEVNFSNDESDDTSDSMGDDDTFSDEQPFSQSQCSNLHMQHIESPLESTDEALVLDGDHAVQSVKPLPLPFSCENSGSHLSDWFAHLREHANLDLFRVPSSTSGTVGTTPNTGASGGGAAATSAAAVPQSSLFDADALTDELERHERILKDFDEFLRDFCSIAPSGVPVPVSTAPEIRPVTIHIQPK